MRKLPVGRCEGDQIYIENLLNYIKMIQSEVTLIVLDLDYRDADIDYLCGLFDNVPIDPAYYHCA